MNFQPINISSWVKSNKARQDIKIIYLLTSGCKYNNWEL